MTDQFIGDDLPNLIKVNRPNNTDDIIILATIVKIANVDYIEKNPVFPYYISPKRCESKKFDIKSPVYMGVWFKENENGETLFKTCIGDLTINFNPQIFKDCK